MAGTVLVIVAAVVAAVDWWAVATGRRSVEIVAKPLTMALLVAVAATVGDASGDVRTWTVVGAAFGVAGDLALLRGDEDRFFMAGLSAFACGHLGYTVAGASSGFDVRWAAPGLAVAAVLLGIRFLSRTVPGARADGGTTLAAAVVVYAALIAAMVIVAWGTAIALAAVGASLFAASDWVLGHRRFVGPLPGGRLSVMVPYHVGQALLILGLSTA